MPDAVTKKPAVSDALRSLVAQIDEPLNAGHQLGALRLGGAMADARAALAADDAAGGWRDISTARENVVQAAIAWLKEEPGSRGRLQDAVFQLLALPPAPAGADEKDEAP